METQDRQSNITINIGPGSAVPSGVSDISVAHTAGISININALQGQQLDKQLAQSTSLSTPAQNTSSQFFKPVDQMAAISRRYAIHESLDNHMKQGMQKGITNEAAKSDPSIMVKVSQVAHQVMNELLRGNMALRVDPHDLHHLFDTIRDQALLYVNGLNQGEAFCPNTLKANIMNHPAVQDFKEMHDPRHGHWTNMKAHPKTGVPSKTVLASHVGYNGKHEEHQHGHLLGGSHQE